MIGQNDSSYIVTLVEDKTGFSIMQKVKKVAQNVIDGIISALKLPREKVKIIIFDNGHEFSRHKKIAGTLSAKF